MLLPMFAEFTYSSPTPLQRKSLDSRIQSDEEVILLRAETVIGVVA